MLFESSKKQMSNLLNQDIELLKNDETLTFNLNSLEPENHIIKDTNAKNETFDFFSFSNANSNQLPVFNKIVKVKTCEEFLQDISEITSLKTSSSLDNNNKSSSEPKFNPYEDNSGTSLSLKYDNFIIVASDTRMCSPSGIYSRDTPKIFRINNFLMTITGFYADGYELYNQLLFRVKEYEATNPITIHSLANLCSKILYSKRFFPYYAYVSLSGFCENKPYVYGYDCIGSYESVNCICNGSGAPLIQPLLDSFIDKKNWHGEKENIDLDKAIEIVIKAFDSCCERDVKTGDYMDLYVIMEGEIKKERIELRHD